MASKVNQPAGSSLISPERLASLSDTIFGVAMTLVVATLLPSIQAQKGTVFGLLSAIRGQLATVVISFAISARFWVSQQQRLAIASSITPPQIRLHLAFLFLIVLVPVSTSLDGLTGSGAKLWPVMIYGTHLLLIAAVNLLLWIGVRHAAAARVRIVRSSLALALFAGALAAGAMRPGLALYFWLAVLATPPLAAVLAQHLGWY
jgi:uncharacterized membrane protein